VDGGGDVDGGPHAGRCSGTVLTVRPAHVPPELRRRPFRGSTAVRAGLPGRRQVDGDVRRRLPRDVRRRLFRDVHVHRDVPVTHELPTVAAGSLLLPGAVVTGPGAAVLWGVDLADADDDVELTVPPDRHPVRVSGQRVRRAEVLAHHRCRRRGGATTPEATAVSVAATSTGDDAVVAVDRLVDSGIVDLGPIRSPAETVRGPGSARARRAAGSPTVWPVRPGRRG
jgi:hypothetical protein